MQKSYLVFVLAISFFLQSCASFAMGKKCPCEDILLPPKPIVENCVANADGTCFSGSDRIPVVNKVCRDAKQDADVFNWIDYAIEVVNP